MAQCPLSRMSLTDDEWTRIRRPLVAGVAISLADPGGPGAASWITASARFPRLPEWSVSV